MLWMQIPIMQYVAIIPDHKKLESIKGIEITFVDFLRLASVGLINFEPLGGYSLTFDKSEETTASLLLIYDSCLYKVTKKAAPHFALGTSLLTDVGQQLAKIAGATSNEAYLEWALATLREQAWEVGQLSHESPLTKPD